MVRVYITAPISEDGFLDDLVRNSDTIGASSTLYKLLDIAVSLFFLADHTTQIAHVDIRNGSVIFRPTTGPAQTLASIFDDLKSKRT